jgi:YihY family inner membrane protein
VVIRDRLLTAASLLGRAFVRGHRDAIGRRASSLAYSTLLSVVPLLAVVSIFLAQAMREDNGRTLRLVAELLPYREDAVVSALHSFVAQAESVSSLAVIGFLITSLMTFFSVQETLFTIFRVPEPPSLARRVLTYTMLFFWGPVLIGSAYGGLLYLEQTSGTLGELLRGGSILKGVPALVTFLGLTMLFWRAAYGRIRLRHAAAGSAVATVLVEVLKLGFRIYVSSFTHVQRAVYGTFAIALFFVISVQLTWWMMLYGAEVAASVGLPGSGRDPDAGPRPDPWIALRALERLAAPGRPSYSANQLAAELGVRPDALRAHLAPLAERGLVESPLSVAGKFRLAVAPGRIRLESVFAAYDPAGHDPERRPGGEAPDDALDRIRERVAGARAEALESTSLDDWLTRGRPGGADAEPGADDDRIEELEAEDAPTDAGLEALEDAPTTPGPRHRG